MADNENGTERTEQPTPQRREKARREGQVAYSQEVGIAGTLLVFCGFLTILAPWLAQIAMGRFRNGLELTPGPSLDLDGATATVRLALIAVASCVGPPALSSMFASAGLGVGQVGFQPNFENLGLKWKRLNPQNWLKKIMSAELVVGLARNLFKGLGIIAIAAWSLRNQPETLDRLVGAPPAALVDRLQEVAITVAGPVTFAVVVVAMLDLLWTRYRHEQKLMMTKQEVKDDLKETEGNPHLKAELRKRAQEIANRRLPAQVETATVVVTNPTHYAVALRYWQGRDNAPVVVAKGVDYRAQRIREIAAAKSIPVIEDRPLARALHGLVDEGDVIPMEFFRPVAKLLAIVYRRRNKQR